MDDEIDHLKEFEDKARTRDAYDYSVLDLRDYWSAKRRDPQALPAWRKAAGPRAPRSSKFTPEQIADMQFSTDHINDVAARNNATTATVRTYRAAKY